MFIDFKCSPDNMHTVETAASLELQRPCMKFLIIKMRSTVLPDVASSCKTWSLFISYTSIYAKHLHFHTPFNRATVHNQVVHPVSFSVWPTSECKRFLAILPGRQRV